MQFKIDETSMSFAHRGMKITHPHLNPLPEGEETFSFPPLQGEG